MMKEGILLPKNISSINDINSKLKMYFKSNNDEEIYSIDFLRLLYKDDRNKFYNVIEEMKLRGFKFFSYKKNNILPQNVVEIYPYILVNNVNGQSYRDLDFTNLGLGGFVNKFDITNDGFFNYIPINGFKMLNRSIDINELSKELEKINFIIIRNENELSKINKEDGTNSYKDKKNEVELLFSSNKYISFNIFCKTRSISLLNQITEEVIQEYSQQPYVGIGKVNAVRKLLNMSETFDNNEIEIIQYYGFDLIEQVFSANKYNKFVTYCKSKDISRVGELTSEHITEFSKIPKIGTKKVVDVKEVLKKYIKSECEEILHLKFSVGELLETLKETYINDVVKHLCINLSFANNRKISELEGYTYEQLKECFDIYELYEVNKKLTNLISFYEVIKEKVSDLDERSLRFIKERRIENKTLEQIGINNNVTRERVRQIIKNGEEKLLNSLITNGFLSFLRFKGESLNYISKDRIMNLLGDDYRFIINMIEQNDDLILYNDILEIFYYDKEQINLKILEKYLEELDEIVNYYDYEDELIDIFKKVGIKDVNEKYIEKVLSKYKIAKHGEILCKLRLTSSIALEFIFENYVKEPLRVDEDGGEYLNYLSKKHLNYNLDITFKSIEGRVRESKKIILVDRLTFAWHDEESISESLVKKIEEYIDSRFEEVDYISCEELFNVFKKDFKMYKVNTKQHANSIVKYYLDEKYEIGHGNTLNIYKNENGKLDRSIILSKTLLELGGKSSKEKLSKLLNWPIYKVEQAVGNSKELLMWNQGNICHISHVLVTEEEIEAFRNIIKMCIKDGFTTSYMILNEMKFDKILSNFINKNNITEGFQIANLIKVFFEEFKPCRQLIMDDTCIYKSFEEVIISRFNSETSRCEILEFCLKYKYKEVTARNIISKLILRQIYIETGEDTLHYHGDLNIDSDVIEKVREYIESVMGNEEYLSLNLLKGYRMKLPKINLRWNPYLIKSLLVNNGYRNIVKKFNDYRFDKIILVRECSKINTFEDLVVYIINNEYKGNMHETYIYDFLAEKGIVKRQELAWDKKLPYEIRAGELIDIDELGVITLK